MMRIADNRIAPDVENHDLEAPGSRFQASEKLQIPNFNVTRLLLCWIGLGLAITGCKSFRPVEDSTRYYLLSASAVAPSESAVNSFTLGIAPVEVPAYLQNSRIVIRRGTNEVHYSEFREWAEHLDKGIQRVLGLDVSTLLPGSRVVTSAWHGGEVKAELYVSIQQFEIDEAGQVTLDCAWRIVKPGGARQPRDNPVRIVKKGPAPASNLTGAVSTMSEALGELSKQIVAALKTQGEL